MIWRMLWFTLAGYLSGSIMYAYYIPRLLTGGDVRTKNEDHNPGAANALRLCGPGVGILCAALDVLKAALPVYLAIVWGGLNGWYLVPVTIAPILGHACPVTLRFRGGKAIASMFGALLGLWPVSHVVLRLAGIVLLLLPLLRNHAVLMFVSVSVFAMLTLAVEPLHFVRLIAAGVLLIVGSRHAREANASLEDARAQLAERREGRRAL